MAKRSVLLDTNIILDVLLDRSPFVESAELLWALSESGVIEGVVPAHCITTIHYISRRYRDDVFACTVVHDVLNVFNTAPVDAAVLRRAVRRPGPDFEDNVCIEAASAVGCHIIVTRDATGFANTTLPVLEPWEALSLLWTSFDSTTT